jgi:hypothetical protein
LKSTNPRSEGSLCYVVVFAIIFALVAAPLTVSALFLRQVPK